MTARIDIRPRDLETVRAILSAHLPPDARIAVFGSRANGRARRGSDLDLAVDAGRALTSGEMIALACMFEASSLPYTVDVVDLHRANATFRTTIERGCVALNEAVSDAVIPAGD